jgi:hypothetical protein
MRLRLIILGMWFTGCGAAGTSELMDESQDTIDADIFHTTIDALDALYRQDVADAAATLRISRDWQGDREDAWSARSGNTWRMWLYGGLARRPELTTDGWRTILCHEMGHFFGGEPLGRGGLAAEAQADYYATSVCLPRLWGDSTFQDAPATEQNPDLPAAIVESCDQWDTERAAICRRSLRAAWTTLHMAANDREQPAPDFLTPDASVVDQTITRYPSVQCRLDTFVAGALDQERPACWYAEPARP